MESQKQVNFGDGVKKGRRGAAVIINPPHPPKKKKGKSEKRSKKWKRGLEPTHPESYAAINSTLLEHPLTHFYPPKKRTEKKRGGKHKKVKERTRTRSSGVLLL